MHPVFIILIVLSAVMLLYLFLVAPGASSKKKRAPFMGGKIAHRGLYTKDQSIPENSLAAFGGAVAAGYGIELDVQLSKDGQVVVFHDDTLSRMCGVERRADELTYGELSSLPLFGTEQRIPLFSEVLSVIGGAVPLVVELKNGKRNGELCEKTLALLRGYEGDFCIESFNPFIVAWFRFHARDILRGQLTQTPDEFRRAGRNGAESFILGRVLFDFAARPQFIAHRIGKKTFSVRTAEALGAMKFAWTCRKKGDGDGYDAIIFEHFMP